MYLGDVLVFEKDKKVFEEVYSSGEGYGLLSSNGCAYISSSSQTTYYHYQHVVTYYVKGYDYVDIEVENENIPIGVFVYALTTTIPTMTNDGTCLIGSSFSDKQSIYYGSVNIPIHYHFLIPVLKDYPYLSINYSVYIQVFPVMSSEVTTETVELPDGVSLSSRNTNSAYEYLGTASGGWTVTDHTGTDRLLYDFSNYEGYTDLSVQIEATTDGYCSYGNNKTGDYVGVVHTSVTESGSYTLEYYNDVMDIVSIVVKTGTTPIFTCKKLIK